MEAIYIKRVEVNKGLTFGFSWLVYVALFTFNKKLIQWWWQAFDSLPTRIFSVSTVLLLDSYRMDKTKCAKCECLWPCGVGGGERERERPAIYMYIYILPNQNHLLQRTSFYMCSLFGAHVHVQSCYKILLLYIYNPFFLK